MRPSSLHRISRGPLTSESPAAFDCHVKRYIADHRPRTSAELTLVHNLAVIRWEQRRLWTLEQDLVRDYTTNTGDSDDQFKAAFVALLDNPKLRNLYQHQDQLRARYQRTLHRLTRLQSLALVPMAA